MRTPTCLITGASSRRVAIGIAEFFCALAVKRLLQYSGVRHIKAQDNAVVAQPVEHFHGKEKVTGANPVNGSIHNTVAMIKAALAKIKNSLPHLAVTFFFCIVLFLLSNTTEIYGGSPCYSSPCSLLNDSAPLEHRKDYFLSARTHFFLAPTGAFVAPLLKMHSGFVVKSYGLSGFSVDRDDGTEDPVRSKARDIRTLSKIYFLTKVLIFLSFPYWLFLIFICKKYLWPTLLGKTFIVSFLVALAVWNLFMTILDYTMGDKVETNQILADFVMNI